MGNEPNIIHGFLTLNIVLHYDTAYLSDAMSTKNSIGHPINVYSLCQKKIILTSQETGVTLGTS